MVELSTTYSPAILCHSQEVPSKSPANRYQTVMQLWLFGVDTRLYGIVLYSYQAKRFELT
jgi:hypothetical protein